MISNTPMNFPLERVIPCLFFVGSFNRLPCHQRILFFRSTQFPFINPCNFMELRV